MRIDGGRKTRLSANWRWWDLHNPPWVKCKSILWRDSREKTGWDIVRLRIGRYVAISRQQKSPTMNTLHGVIDWVEGRL